jgi:hypothetical protein
MLQAPSAAWSDTFYERIAGGYALMAMDFTPKDMLLLMFASPEIPEFGGNFTNITEIEQSVNSRSTLLNIVNNVINRILLAEDYDFSYKDDIYLSSVLRRLGITDEKTFFREAVAAVNESRMIERLTERYEQSGAVLRESAAGETAAASVGREPESAEGDGVGGETPREAVDPLFSEIVHRVGTDRILSFMQSYGAYSVGERVSTALELNASEWIGMLNAVNLFDYRKGISVSEFSPIHRHYNAYETGLALNPDSGDETVIGSVVAAAWINMAQNAFLSRIARAAHTDVSVNVDVSHVFPAAAARTLERFRSWHTERGGSVYAERMFESSLQSLDRLEERILAQISGEIGYAASPARIMHEGDTEHAVSEDAVAGEPELPDMGRYFNIFRNIKQERFNIEQLIGLAKSPKGYETIRQILSRAHTSEISRTEGAKTTTIHYLLNELRTVMSSGGEEGGRIGRVGGADTGDEPQTELRMPDRDDEMIRAFLENVQTTEIFGREIPETERIHPVPDETRAAKDESGDAQAAQGTARDMNEIISEAIERGAAEITLIDATEPDRTEMIAATYNISETVDDAEAEQTSRENLKATLDEYDRRNKEIAQKLAERAEAMKRDKTKALQESDVEKRGAREALEGLADTEKFLKDLREANEVTQKSGQPASPELTLLLSSVAPEYREIYERILFDLPGAMQDESSGIRSAGIVDLNADLAAAREHNAAELQHLEREVRGETEILRERVERTIEREAPTRRTGRAKGYPFPREPVRLRHRQQDESALPDGMMAGQSPVAAERTNREVTVKNIVTHDNVIETEINRAVRDIEAKSARDIENVISKALSEQMRMMESRIYSGVERKLDLERARRGK